MSKARFMPGKLSAPPTGNARRVACRPAVDLLHAARENGTRSATYGLTALLCRADPIPARRGRGELVARGLNVTIEPVGKGISADAAALLLDFAAAYFDRERAP